MGKIAVIAAGIGTAKAVSNIVKAANYEVDLVTQSKDLTAYSHLILPGVGHFQEGVKQLENGDWLQAIKSGVSAGKLLLGICLGMQLLGNGSEEGEGSGLSLINFESKIMVEDGENKVPNIGWSAVEKYSETELLSNFMSPPRFYFVHSYAVPISSKYTLATTCHSTPFSSVIGKENVFGVQFHPEKSHSYGKTLISNFLEMKN